MADIFDEVEEDLRAERARRMAQRWGGVALVYMACGVLGLIGTVLTRETWGKRQRAEVDEIIARS